MRVSVQLAHTKEQYEQAFRLLQRSRKQLGFSSENENDLWVTKHHALPCTNTIVALRGGEVVGAITLFGESAFRLPLEEQADLSAFRHNLNGRVAEFSVVGCDQRDRDVLLALYHYALCFGSMYCHYDAFVTHVPQAWAREYAELLQYEPLLLKEKLPGMAFYRSARDGADFREALDGDFEFRFPEKKFFLVAHQSIEPKTLDYLFNQKTQLFENLTDLELRVLKNFYDHGDFAKVLPDRRLQLPFKKVPQSRRFAMNCEGYLCLGDGRRMHLQVLDVSREGLKIRTEDALPAGVYPLTLSIGITKQAEVIAATVWVDEMAQIAGLSVKSGDKNWLKLIEYLEQESLRVAA